MSILRTISTITKAVSDIINPPPADPLRFADFEQYPANFHGEMVGRRVGNTAADRVKISDGGHVEFLDGANPYAGIAIESTLTAKDVQMLKDNKYDPTNPNYAKAKAYFAERPWCNKEEMANYSGVGVGTAKDLIPGFKRNI